MKERMISGMLITLSIFFLAGISPPAAAAGQITLMWDEPTTYADGTTPMPFDVLGGYKIYYGTASGNYFMTLDVGRPATCGAFPSVACSYVVENLTPGITYFFVATVYTLIYFTESDYSNEVFKMAGGDANYPISLTFGANGRVCYNGTCYSASPRTASVASGANQSFTFSPNTGYHVADVVVDGASVGAVESYTFNNVLESHTLNATFAINTYTVNASAGANGQIIPSGNTTLNYGDSLAMVIIANTGYHITDLIVDGASVGPVTNYTFSGVDANHTISASFAINTFSIQATAGAGGSISPSGTITANYGANQTFNIAPNDGYYISAVFVDGISMGAQASYTFSSVSINHEINACFTEIADVQQSFLLLLPAIDYYLK